MARGTQAQLASQGKVAAEAATHPLFAPLPKLPGMTPATYAKLHELCGPRALDVLLHLPRTLLDRSSTATISAAVVGERTTLVVQVVRRGPFPARGSKRPLSIDLTDASGSNLRAIFFNPQGWLERAFPLEAEVIVSGKIETDAKGKKMLHPDVWGGMKGLENVAKIFPVYPSTAGLAQGWQHRAAQAALALAEANPLPEWLPKAVRAQYQLPTFAEALQQAHTPTKAEDLEATHPARVRLALDEFYATQLALQHARAQTRSLRGLAHGRHTALRARLLTSLPFAPTADQTTALNEIVADLQAPRPMLRLLQGDVGSGKTLVAMLAALHVIENGHQVALMAPTEILAQQLFFHAQKMLQPLGITVSLLVGSQSTGQKKRLKQHLRDGFINLLIGTHALVEASEGNEVVFDKLGLVIIDEQHRFGVKARANLSANQPLPPDVLVMTATPIPRTLALTAYGDMDVSTLREKPPGRTPIGTQVMSAEKLPELATRLQAVFAKGQQAYWVCPLVEESAESDLSDATSRAAWLQQLYGTEKVGLLHGKLKPADKAAVMADFKDGKLALLVATTVVEVGVDVPNATVMVIEHAERFGLAQLHQLRGRVGRGVLSSSCVLVYSPPLSGYAQQRLAALRNSEDGFYLAEQDLELRGPGEVLGTAQAGQQRTRLADLSRHRDLLPIARTLAEEALTKPLSAAQRNALALLLDVFDKHAAAQYLRAG